MTQTQTWLPGKDYPDREAWLTIRDTPRWFKKLISRWIYSHNGPRESDSGTRIWKPMMVGINKAKRTADAAFMFADSKHPAKHGARREIIRQRQAYYRRMIDGQKN